MREITEKTPPIPPAHDGKPCFFVLMHGSGPSDGQSYTMSQKVVTGMAMKNAERARQEGAAPEVIQTFEGLRMFAERMEVGAVFVSKKVIAFCMSEPNAIYRITADLDPEDLPG